MRIMVINPNTSTQMTDRIGSAAQSVVSGGTEIMACSPSSGPASIEGHFDEAVSTVAMLEEVVAGEKQGVDAYVIACFGDPGLLAARELASGPVIGMAEAAMQFASTLATRFSIVTSLKRTEAIARQLVRNYGMEHRCASIRSCNLPVLDLDVEDAAVYSALLETCRLAVELDEADALVLGCAGMAGIAEKLSSELGVPVVEGVTAGVKLAESLVCLGLKTAKRGDLAFPRPKTFTGTFTHYSSGLPGDT